MRNILVVLVGLAPWLLVSDALRILTVMSVRAPSHHIWFSSLPVALAEKGHHVHSIDIKMPKKQPPTLTVGLLNPPDKAVQQELAHILKVFNTGTVLQQFDAYATISVASCDHVLSDDTVQKIISPDFKQQFDVIILDYAWHECLFGFIHRFNNTPTIIASPFPHPVPIMRQLGNPMFHGLPHYFKTYPVPMNFLDRLSALAMYLYDEYMYSFYEEPAMEELMRRKFGKDCPPISELIQHVALAFVNMVDTKPRPPLVANIIPVGGMHIPPVEPLSEDLQRFLDGAKDGAVVMSFGSLVRGDGIGDDRIAAVLKVFSKLPQKLVWKYESAAADKFGKLPPNVKLLSWLPQNDLLAHPNMRLFISHCGGLSTQEAAYHGIPVLGTPFIVDQYANVEQVVAAGMGLKLPLAELTEETFYGNVTELLKNPKYYETAQRTKSVMQDQLVKPLDRAVFYVEYVARHRGAPHLRSPLAGLPFLSRTMYVDLALVVAALTLVLTLAVTIVIKMLCGCKKTKVTDSKKRN